MQSTIHFATALGFVVGAVFLARRRFVAGGLLCLVLAVVSFVDGVHLRFSEHVAAAVRGAPLHPDAADAPADAGLP